MSRTTKSALDRVLVLTPTGRDAEMLCQRLIDDDMPCDVCADLPALLAGLSGGAGAAVVAQEALTRRGAAALLAALEAQEPWSDIPILFLSEARSHRPPNVVPAFLERANITILQRPLTSQLFMSGIRSAIRARRRQYQMRDLYCDLERAVKLGDMFVGILGHDLRTPLGAIQMSAELIVRASEDARALKPAGRILTSADRMTRMIEQLLDFARVRQGRGIRLEVSSADLGELARQVLQELGDANPLARLDVSFSGDLTGRWDPDRLGQVVSNLVGNAIQHGTAGNAITVELEGTQAGTVRLCVTNAGAIRAEAMPTLFEPFNRLADSKGREKGLGLGLFIAREIVRAHGGDIRVREVDGACAFEATLPREAKPIESEVLTPA
jgi:two-component system, sensor histidine kinase and response regulator